MPGDGVAFATGCELAHRSIGGTGGVGLSGSVAGLTGAAGSTCRVTRCKLATGPWARCTIGPWDIGVDVSEFTGLLAEGFGAVCLANGVTRPPWAAVSIATKHFTEKGSDGKDMCG